MRDKYLPTIEDYWTMFEGKAIKDEAPDVIKRELKAAYYNGAIAAMRIQNEILKAELGEEETVLKWMDMENEIALYLRQAKKDFS